MNTQKYRIASGAAFAFFCAGLAVSTANAEDRRTVVGSVTPLTDQLGGRKVGELYLTAKVNVLEVKGDWARVNVEGWAKVKELSAAAPGATMEAPASGAGSAGAGTSGAAATASSTTGSSAAASAPADANAALSTVTQDVLKVTDFITAHRTDIDPPRMYVTLTLKNLTANPISKWSGMLVAQTEDGKVVFREQISQDSAKINSNSSTEASFYWEPHEDAYDRLLAAEKMKIKFSLGKVTAQ